MKGAPWEEVGGLDWHPVILLGKPRLRQTAQASQFREKGSWREEAGKEEKQPNWSHWGQQAARAGSKGTGRGDVADPQVPRRGERRCDPVSQPAGGPASARCSRGPLLWPSSGGAATRDTRLANVSVAEKGTPAHRRSRAVAMTRPMRRRGRRGTFAW